MKYIPVTGLNPVGAVKDVILNHFKSALISIAEPTTSKAWTVHQVYKQMDRVFKNFVNDKVESLYLDSGGFQVLMNYITKRRLREYTDVYHILLERFKDKNFLIFSLDILNKKFTEEEIYKFNDYSIDESIRLITKYPELQNKQLFVIQSRFPKTLEIWKNLIDKHNIFDYYTRYSFGGLVGLKKETNAKFNHFVPMTYWLLENMKDKNKIDKIKHLHMLGQSSRVAIITAKIMELHIESYYNIKMEITMDSSEVVRFSPIEAKLPLIMKAGNEFKMARTKDDLAIMLENNISLKADGYNLDTALEHLKNGKVTNEDFVEIVCQGISSTMDFADEFINDFAEDIFNKNEDGSYAFFDWTEDTLKDYHPIFKQGRLAQEIINNIQYIKKMTTKNNFEEVHNQMMSIVRGYYE